MHSCERHRAVTSWKPHARGRPLRLQFSQQLARQIAPWAPIQRAYDHISLPAPVFRTDPDGQ